MANTPTKPPDEFTPSLVDEALFVKRVATEERIEQYGLLSVCKNCGHTRGIHKMFMKCPESDSMFIKDMKLSVILKSAMRLIG